MKYFFNAAGQSGTLFVLLLQFNSLRAQVTISTGPDWKNATVINRLTPAEAYKATTNYGTNARACCNRVDTLG
jgi:hypothetical protein